MDVVDFIISPFNYFIIPMRKRRAYRNSWTLNASVGRGTLDPELWTLGSGLLTLDARFWTGRWTLHSRLWKLDSGTRI